MKLGRTGWVKDKFIEAIKNNTSVADVGVELGADVSLPSTRGSILYYIQKFSLDTSHFVQYSPGMFERDGRTKIPLSDILVENSSYSNIASLKKRLLEADLLEYKCYICGIFEWIGAPITLQLDHINGNHFDHRLENLRLLCPNCHVQQETSHGKRLKGRKRKREDEYVKYYCEECGKEVFGYKSKLCRECFCIKAGKNYTQPWPPDEELIEMVLETNVKAACEKLGVSMKRFRARLKNRKLWQTIKDSPRYKPYRQKTVIDWPVYDNLIKLVNTYGYTLLAEKLGVAPNAIKTRISRKGLLHLVSLKRGIKHSVIIRDDEIIRISKL